MKMLMVFVAAMALASGAAAQSIEWGAKAGVNSTTVPGVPEYYDFLLCCHPLFPDARVEAAAGTGFTAGGFVAMPLHRAVGVQGELLLSRKRHSVDFRPYYASEATFTRDYVEAAGLLTLRFPAGGRSHIYVEGGPVFGFRIGEHADTSDAALNQGTAETNIYIVQALVYAAPALLRGFQPSVALGGGWEYRRLLVEVRFTQGLQSIFKDREGLLAGFIEAGGDPATLARLIPLFAPSLESAKSRDIAVLAGFRF